MRRHHEKRRDMARSVLPSTRRERARTDLANIKRAHRHGIRQDLRALASPVRVSCPDDPPDYLDWDERVDLRRTTDIDISGVVWVRRGGDKLGPLIRWGIASTAHLPIEDRLGHLHGVLPAGLIGRHAMSHLRDEADLLPREQMPPWRIAREEWRARRSDRTEIGRQFGVIRQILLDVLETPDGLRDLNAVMKACDRHASRRICDENGCIRRCLAGRHDIEAFMTTVHLGEERGRLLPSGAGLPYRQFRIYLAALAPTATQRSS